MGCRKDGHTTKGGTLLSPSFDYNMKENYTKGGARDCFVPYTHREKSASSSESVHTTTLTGNANRRTVAEIYGTLANWQSRQS